MKFHALERSLLTIRHLRPVVATVSRHDPSLAKQLRTAASSIALNLSEANGRTGRDRTHLFRIALGSAKESHTAVSLAVAWGYLQEDDAKLVLEHLDALAAMTWRLAGR